MKFGVVTKSVNIFGHKSG